MKRNFLRGKMNIGGTDEPVAETATNRVTLVPRSPDVINPTFRFPLAATIFDGMVTVDRPVSSAFHMEKAVNLNRQLNRFSTTVRFSFIVAHTETKKSLLTHILMRG